MNEDGLKCMIDSFDGLNPQKIQSLYFDLNRYLKGGIETSFSLEFERIYLNFFQISWRKSKASKNWKGLDWTFESKQLWEFGNLII